MTRARARSLWLAGPALLAACTSSAGTPTSTPESTSPGAVTLVPTSATSVATTPAATAATSTVPPPSTLVPVNPLILIPIALGNKAFPADADDLVTQHRGYTGDPNATLQAWLITPMAVPSGPDVRLLGFERTVGINSTTATFLTGAIDPEVALTSIEAALAPTATYTVTPSTRVDGTITIFGFDAEPNTVQGDPPGWSVEASAVDQLGIVHIKRIDYAFAKVVPTFSDLPPILQTSVVNQDAIAVTVGGLLTSIAYEYGVRSLGETPVQRTRLGYDITKDFTTSTDDLRRLLTTGWSITEQSDVIYFTSTTTSEVWTLDEVGDGTHLTYDTGS